MHINIHKYFIIKVLKKISPDISVDIVMGYRLDGQGSIPSRGKGISPSPQCPDWGPSHCVQQLGHEADYSPPSTLKVKNGRTIPSVPHTSSWYSV
jgi:hypothetical protein